MDEKISDLRVLCILNVIAPTPTGLRSVRAVEVRREWHENGLRRKSFRHQGSRV